VNRQVNRLTRPELRRNQRVRLPEDSLLRCEGIGTPLDGRVSVLGLTGLFVRTRDAHPVGATLVVRLYGSDKDIVEGQCVVRDVLPGGMGLEFTVISEKDQQALKRLLERLKS
jgi:hypothetical protein